MTFDPISFIQAKKDGRAHPPDDIDLFIRGAVSGKIPDYQVSAWLMAVCLRGLNFSETLTLTKSMTGSGKVFKWDRKGPPVVDKHSTGGVGDTVTLVVAPLVAAMGMRMGKHSGRGLGHTGGTIDKLESIPGFRTSLSEDEFREVVNRAGCAVCGQDRDMTPADGLMYAIRDVTATVDQESLIASSIMSKKLAGGADYILLDVKVGSGAFMKDVESAESLAKLMIRIGKKCGKTVKAVISSMEEPLGGAVGNALEVAEAIKVLRNGVAESDNLGMLCIEVAARLGSMCGFGARSRTRKAAAALLEDGSALDRFREMVALQGGDPSVADNPESVLPRASRIVRIPAGKTGYVRACDALAVGELVRDLGGGRKSKGDIIDPAVGVVLCKRVGERVSEGETLCEVHTNGRINDKEAVERAERAYVIGRRESSPHRLILN